ncbi:MAG: tetraacyldisaccharide 4'-kinase [bacterium]
MYKNILSYIYSEVVKRRNKHFDKNPDKLVRLNTPVICVGNLNVGGTGKTPFVQMLTWLLLNNNVKPAIVGLGYKRKSKGTIIVCDGKKVLVDAQTAGDEMFLLAESLGVPVVVNEKKYKAAQIAEEMFKPDIIIVDDGFQHRKLYRDLDILLVDKDTILKPYLLPKGRLREPLSSVERADVISYTTDTYPSKEFSALIKHGSIEIAVDVFEGKPMDLIHKRYFNPRQLGSIKKSVFAFSGIAKPKRFLSVLKHNRWNVVGYKHFGDHHSFSAMDIKSIVKLALEADCTTLITTEKDATKLAEFTDIFNENKMLCVVYPIRLRITNGFPYFKSMINNVLNQGHR